MLHKCAKLVANLQGEGERGETWLRHCKCATCDMLHATCYMHWAWQRLVSHVWQVVNKRQIKCHCVLRAVTMANPPLFSSSSLSLSLLHCLSLSLCGCTLLIRHAAQQSDSSLTICWHNMQIELQIRSAGHMSSYRGWKLLDIIEIAHTQCCTRQVKPKAGFKAL